jgi:PIN domain nuclease of toxin-antitoxin system
MAALLLLDTHVWVWFAQQDSRLANRPVVGEIDAALRESRVGVSAISVWEVAMLDAKGRVDLGPDCLGWLRDALALPGMSLLALSPEIAVESVRLPGGFHADPADRVIVATARVLGADLLTADAEILRYGQAGHVRATAIG